MSRLTYSLTTDDPPQPAQVGGKAAGNPQVVFEQAQRQRQAARAALHAAAERQGPRRAHSFEKQYSVLASVAGFRESIKYEVIQAMDPIRARLIAAGETLARAGRLDRADQVFDLTLADLDRGLADPGLDLRACIAAGAVFRLKLRHVRHFPRLIDSRGKIVRLAPGPAREGELSAEPISPGVARGPVKVLHRPDEKPILPGDILVARATDPGWTPLFLNAAGIILEMGGVLQHGALVAREYGKPCVAGLERATDLLSDGQRVELDGAAGRVRLLAEPPATGTSNARQRPVLPPGEV